MNQSEEAFLKELRKAFASEAEEHLQTIAAGLIDIEKQRDPVEGQATVESVFRAAHSLKGAARAVNLPAITAVCQSMENVISAMKKGTLIFTAEGFDLLQRAVDSMGRMIAAGPGEEEAGLGGLIEQLDHIAGPRQTRAWSSRPPESMVMSTPEVSTEPVGVQGETPTPAPGSYPTGAVAPGKPADTIRISTGKLDSILLQAEELISVKLASEQRIAELKETLDMFGVWKKEREKAGAKPEAARRSLESRTFHRSGAPSASAVSLTTDSFDPGLTRLNEIETRLSALLVALQSDGRTTGLLVDQLLEGTKAVLMLPFSTLLQTFPKMVRDISREQNKMADLVVNGAEIEIDKRILERMKDPLIHLLRNGIDHGIEKPEVRKAGHKSECGTITVDVSQTEGNRVQILVSDDGGGIDEAKLREAVVKRGILSRGEANSLDEKEALMLVFKSGVSTSSIITDLSGRGLGMAIVQEAVEELGGRVSLETAPGQGTTFRIGLPLTLATFRGMLFREHGQVFAVPTSSVERALRIGKEDIRSVENRETIMVNGEPLSLVRLGTALGLASAAAEVEAKPMLSVIVLNNGQQRMAFVVDHLLHEQEILIKELGRQLVRVRNIAGATVLGSGKVVPVLNVADLMKSAVRTGRTSSSPQPAKAETRPHSILVVEDSITSRMLLKNILASAGFGVRTAVDGVEAWAALIEDSFDVVVSDVEMPRLNGFDLTARIRSDEKLAELPVVLVTALESRSDRERGIEVGANAYIVKSSFDQSNLLDVVRRLL